MPLTFPQAVRNLPAPPLFPLTFLLGRLMRRVATRHPAILTRLGPHAGARILIDAQEGPVLFLMEPAARRLTAHERSHVPPHDACITGPMADFLSMLHGLEDGDTLFFSGRLTISGDTSAVLALRNALDDAELDLTEEIIATLAAGDAAARLMRWGLRRAGALAGVSLHRQPEDR